jgi:ABC-type branched-subunit amino acid transport system ATPase component
MSLREEARAVRRHPPRRFGGLVAVHDLSLEMARGEVLGLIGPNGAGKTTAFNLLSGFLTPDEGTVHFDGHPLVGLKPHAICGLGLARTFRSSAPSPSSVLDTARRWRGIRGWRRRGRRRR